MKFNNSTKLNVQCSFKVRKDNLKNLTHDHIFKNEIGNYFNNEFKKIEPINDIEEKLFLLVGKSNLSIKTAASNELYSLLASTFKLGQLKKDQGFQNVFSKICRTTFTNHFIEYSKNIKTNRILKFRGISALCVDSGKIGGTSILNIVLINVNKTEEKPILFKSIWNFVGCFESYKKEIFEAIIELKKYNIEISGLVTDNLPVQVKVLDHRNVSSLINNCEDKIISNLIRVPCQCHTINLALNDWLSDEKRSDLVPIVKVICNLFRKKQFKNIFYTKLMPFCPTRWTNLFEIINWGKLNIKRIFAVLKTNNLIIKNILEPFIEEVKYFIFSIVPNYYRILFIYSKLIKSLESDYCSASRSALIYEFFFDIIKENLLIEFIKDENIHFTELVESIKNRLFGTGNYELIYFLSSFTFQGRKLIRDNLGSGHIFELDPDYIQFSPQK